MKATINWTTATPEQKNACFAEHVAGRVPPFETIKAWEEPPDDCAREVDLTRDSKGNTVPDYLHSADAVLPWLEECDMCVEINRDPCCDTWAVTFTGRYFSNKHIHAGPCETFPEAAMIALLRANGIEVVT